MNNTVLVVGGAGYIGSHMVLALRHAGCAVTAFDNLSRGFADAVDADLLRIGDLRSKADLDSCMGSQSFDLVMHFAGLSCVGESVSDPEVYYDNNIIGTLNLLAAMRRAGVQRLVFSSSCAIYGEPDVIPIRETCPQRPINPYGRTKLLIEQALSDYATAYGMESITLRYFNAAGSDSEGRAGERHDPESHLIPVVLQEALRVKNGGDPTLTRLTVFGHDFPTADGSCVRDYIHVSDICRAHLLAADRLLQERVVGAEFYNLANGQGYSVFDVIETCRKITGQPIQYRVLPHRVGDPPMLVGNAQRAAEVLGWSPEIGDLASMVSTAWKWLLSSGAHELT